MNGINSYFHYNFSNGVCFICMWYGLLEIIKRKTLNRMIYLSKKKKIKNRLDFCKYNYNARFGRHCNIFSYGCNGCRMRNKYFFYNQTI